jgi:hypothetical protein
MKINHIANIPDTMNVFINDTEVQHPKSFMASSRINNIHFTLSAHPAGKTDKDWITLSAFVDGKQFVVFSGTPTDAADFFSKFPRN